MNRISARKPTTTQADAAAPEQPAAASADAPAPVGLGWRLALTVWACGFFGLLLVEAIRQFWWLVLR